MNSAFEPQTLADAQEWDAFRYLAGEMSPGESDAFERRLADDLTLCETLARMTDITVAARSALAAGQPAQERPATITLQTAEPATVRPPSESLRAQRRFASAAGVTASLAALGLLAAVLLTNRAGNVDPADATTAARQSGDLRAASLISQWSEQTSQLDDEFRLPEERPREPANQDLDESEIGPPSIPGWLLAAVSLSPEASGDDLHDPQRLPMLREEQ